MTKLPNLTLLKNEIAEFLAHEICTGEDAHSYGNCACCEILELSILKAVGTWYEVASAAPSRHRRRGAEGT